MTWNSIQQSDRRLKRLWFAPEYQRKRYQKTPVYRSSVFRQGSIKVKADRQSEVFQDCWEDWQDFTGAVLNNRTQKIWRSRFKTE